MAAHGESLALGSALRQGPRQTGGADQIEDQPEQAGGCHPLRREQPGLIGGQSSHISICTAPQDKGPMRRASRCVCVRWQR